MSIAQRLMELGISLPPVAAPAGNYANAVRTGNLLYLSAKGPLAEQGVLPRGKLGREFSAEQGYHFARSATLNLLAVMQSELGKLDRVTQIIEVQGFLNATEDFAAHARVLDGCSDLLAEVFANRGRHARSVQGVNSLREGLPVVLKAVIEVQG